MILGEKHGTSYLPYTMFKDLPKKKGSTNSLFIEIMIS